MEKEKELKIERFYTAREVAEIIGVTMPTLKKMIKMGQIKPTRFAMRMRFAQSEIQRFIDGKN